MFGSSVQTQTKSENKVERLGKTSSERNSHYHGHVISGSTVSPEDSTTCEKAAKAQLFPFSPESCSRENENSET